MHAMPLITTVLAVHRDSEHRFSKQSMDSIELRQGLGVVGDAHWGRTVQHRSRVKAIVVQGGKVQAGDTVTVKLPAMPHRKMERV